MKQWLIMECEGLSDQWECDAYRYPILITSNEEKMRSMRSGNEVYEINEDGTLVLIKAYDDYDEEGMALYYWYKEENKEITPPHVLMKFPNLGSSNPIPNEVGKYFLLDNEDFSQFEDLGFLNFESDFDGHEDVDVFYSGYRDNEFSDGYEMIKY